MSPETPAPAPEPVKPKTLVQKLCEVMAAVERVAKRGRNEFHRYDYVTEADLADAIRGELASRHIFIFPNVTNSERHDIQVESSKGVRKTALTEINVEWTFVDGESGEERTINIPGCGEDSVDKGFYKAFTGSEKYMLMKSFLIPTGDDPERDSKEDAKAAKVRGKEEAKDVAKDKIAEIKHRMAEDQRRIVWIKTMPNSDLAISGYIVEEAMLTFFADCAATRKKSAKDGGVYWQLAPNYLADFKHLCEKMEIEIG